ncbi:DUF1302 domain-containing protein [Sulfurimonas sp. SAG-AH-194-I05]|nr:DUF1302 family protein [Sulfurimonas sp. SAG-AH-194-I05]MDF1874485.1 DUF1302 domain-containing protein [Sulfurimonas sp. SAG-AH-194-I05]
MNPLISFVFVSLIACGNVYAETTLEDDLGGFEITEEPILDDLDGFDEEELTSELDELSGFENDDTSDEMPLKLVTNKENTFSLSGALTFKTAYGYKNHTVDNVEYKGFNQAQTSLYLQLDSTLSDTWKVRISGDVYYDALYDIQPNTNYNKDVTDAYKTQVRLDDTYLQGRLTNALDVKIGRQKVVWGKSDSLRVTDVINPIDNRLPGMTDIEDLRLSVAMIKLDYYVGMWNFSGMVIPENRIFLEAPVRGEFFPVDAIFTGAPNPFIELKNPSTSFDTMQYALAANGIFSGWDLSFYTAHVLDQKWYINPSTNLREVTIINMLGSALNIATGSWLLKSEIAYLNGIRYNSTVDAKERVDIVVGFDYMGIKDTVLSLEIVNRHIFDYETQMAQPGVKADFVDQDEMQTALRYSRSFSNDSINANALVSMFGQSFEYGGFARVWVSYAIQDALNATVGFVDYRDGDKPFVKAISDNDRVFFDITYSF